MLSLLGANCRAKAQVLEKKTRHTLMCGLSARSLILFAARVPDLCPQSFPRLRQLSRLQRMRKLRFLFTTLLSKPFPLASAALQRVIYATLNG